MPALKALWLPLATQEGLQRSSHALSVSAGKAFVFGGELKPRTPVDAAVTELDLRDESSRTLAAHATTEWPSGRVGATFVSAKGKVYLWGGRGGKDMGTFAGETGIWAFDPSTASWAQHETNGEQPEPRSFHTMAACGDNLYLHAGCPASGRLAQLHSLDLTNWTWTRLPDAPEPARGGTVLTALPACTASTPLLARYGGFAGYEVGGLDIYDVEAQKWSTIDEQVEGGGEGPGKRSVQSFVGTDGALEYKDKVVVALLSMGEREAAPKELGHDGAGFFHSDAWALLATKDAAPTFSWLRLESSARSKGQPEPRGWLASTLVAGSQVIIHGGLNAKNERLADAWTLEALLE
ncbi:uncharacterized protein JCM10292_003115 [Rhodotorula paludigena]|uniref:uncharacterized protein n=1 Tax=Rhodotorula paludigena TaxID=86838 RepID=UPI003181D2C6